jgi:hypothetical protein
MDWFPRLSFHLSKASASAAFDAKLALQQNSNNTIQLIKIATEKKTSSGHCNKGCCVQLLAFIK